jgi:hypothetical protein
MTNRFIGKNYLYLKWIYCIDNTIISSIISLNARKRKVALRILIQRVSVGERKQRILK